MHRYDEKFIPQHFAKTLEGFAKEVLSKEVYQARGVKGLQLMDIKILYFLDDFRGDIKVPLTVSVDSRESSYDNSYACGFLVLYL